MTYRLSNLINMFLCGGGCVRVCRGGRVCVCDFWKYPKKHFQLEALLTCFLRGLLQLLIAPMQINQILPQKKKNNNNKHQQNRYSVIVI